MYTGSLVRLRALEEADLNDLWRHLNDMDTMRLVTDAPVLPATAADAEKILLDQTSHSTGVYQFAVEDLEDGRFLGRCGFTSLDRKNRHGEIAIHLGESAAAGGAPTPSACCAASASRSWACTGSPPAPLISTLPARAAWKNAALSRRAFCGTSCTATAPGTA